MITSHLLAASLPTALRSMRHWLFHLGGLGLIPLGLLDNSPIPLPGIMDVATIVLSARQQQLWLYYALMATAGSVIGGFASYRLASKGGKEALEHRFSPGKSTKFAKSSSAGASAQLPSRLSTPACTYGSISVCGGRYAISGKEIPGGAYAWPNFKIHDSGLLGRALWAANNRVHRITRTPRRSHDHRGVDCHSGCGFLLSGRKKGKTWTQH